VSLWNPILVKEMRTRMRGKRAFLVLTGYVLALSAIIGLIYTVIVATTPVAISSRSGVILTPVLIHVQMALICLIAPTFSAGAVSSEREQQTFDLLVVSLAKPSTIMIGKVGASLSYLLLTLFGSLPLISLTYSFGGVALSDIAISYLVMLVAGVTYCSVSFLWSLLIKRSVMAQLTSIVVVVGLVAGLPALALLFTALSAGFGGPPPMWLINITFLLFRTNPFAAIASQIPGFPMPPNVWLQSVPMWVSQVLFYLVLTGVSLVLSLRRLHNVRKWL
jgi:ABC-type transport system involved in multi-copper enzyme maturation permease subunit